MKRKFLAMALGLVPMVGFVACDDDDNENQKENTDTPVYVYNAIKTVSSGASDCLGAPNASKGGEADPSVAYCDYSYDAQSHRLKLIVNNIIRNCEFTPKLTANSVNNKVSVYISSPSPNEQIAKCDCTYSDTIVLGNFTDDVYTLELHDRGYLESSGENLEPSTWDDNFQATVELDLSMKSNIDGRVYIDQKELPVFYSE